MSDKKLIRLTTTDTNCIFQNEFHDEIIIKEKSEIAFQSLSMIKEPTRLIVGANNDTGTFQIQAVGGGFGGLHNYNLPHGNFSDTNFDTLLAGIEDNMNKALSVNADIENGTVAEVQISSGHKFFVNFPRDPFMDTNSLFFEDTACTINGANGQLNKTQDLPSPVNSFGLANTNYSFNFTKGCGSMRARINLFANHAVLGADNGFFIGLTQNPQKLKNLTGADVFTLADMDFAIKTPLTTTTTYSSIINGVETASLLRMIKFDATTALNTHDYIDISLSKGNIIGTVYYDGGQVELFTTPYDYVNKPNYYGFIIPMAGASNIIVDEIRCTIGTETINSLSNPTLFNSVGVRASKVGSALLSDTVTNIPQPKPQATASNYIINWPTRDTAIYLGYQEQNLTLRANPPTVDPMFLALEGFQPVQDSDIYLVELLNIPLNSFDGFTEGRKNILAVIPVNERNVGQKDSVLQYEANNLNFITLKNDYEFSLRNIRARIVNARFEPIITEGLSSLTFYIRQYKE